MLYAKHLLPWGYFQIKNEIRLVKIRGIKINKILEFLLKIYMRHAFSSWLIRCVNMKEIWLILWKIQSRHDLFYRWRKGQTDGRTKWNQYTPSHSLAKVITIQTCTFTLSVTWLQFSKNWNFNSAMRHDILILAGMKIQPYGSTHGYPSVQRGVHW